MKYEWIPYKGQNIADGLYYVTIEYMGVHNTVNRYVDKMNAHSGSFFNPYNKIIVAYFETHSSVLPYVKNEEQISFTDN